MLFLSTDASMASAWGGLGSMVIVYGLFFVAIWFFIFRPQSKERKRIAGMLANLEVGDCVLTTSGFYGIIIDITDDTVIVEFGNNKNCRIPMDKSAISKVEKANE
ncbi:MAG: preprotein translocase subunit YajC [Lachnospiraceae bacterium]|nr:preprotein translocase subunit YajC [Lachnospiraceae bacterium]